jgi:hypothetical protein
VARLDLAATGGSEVTNRVPSPGPSLPEEALEVAARRTAPFPGSWGILKASEQTKLRAKAEAAVQGFLEQLTASEHLVLAAKAMTEEEREELVERLAPATNVWGLGSASYAKQQARALLTALLGPAVQEEGR